MTYHYVPEEVAARPTTGEVIVNNWWIVHPEKGLAFYQGHTNDYSPQCNRDRNVADHIQPRLHPDSEVRQVPQVYIVSVHKWFRENVEGNS